MTTVKMNFEGFAMCLAYSIKICSPHIKLLGKLGRPLETEGKSLANIEKESHA